MTKTIHYLIVKEKNKKAITYFEYDKLSGFNMTSKSKNIKLKDAINVNQMIIINPSFIEKLINKKINSRLRKLIDIIAGSFDDDEDPANGLMIALNEVEKFKREMINKYLEYMSKEQLKFLNQKIKILEDQITMQAYVINEMGYHEEWDYETKKSR